MFLVSLFSLIFSQTLPVLLERRTQKSPLRTLRTHTKKNQKHENVQRKIQRKMQRYMHKNQPLKNQMLVHFSWIWSCTTDTCQLILHQIAFCMHKLDDYFFFSTCFLLTKFLHHCHIFFHDCFCISEAFFDDDLISIAMAGLWCNDTLPQKQSGSSRFCKCPRCGNVLKPKGPSGL